MTSAALPYTAGYNSVNELPTRSKFLQDIPRWALLLAGVALLPLATLKWNLAPLAWIAPVPFLLYMSRPGITWRHRFALLLALLAACNLMTLKLITDPVPWMLMPGYGVPIALTLWCVYIAWGAIRHSAGERWALYAFPALMALAETFGYRMTEFGVWGAAANSQLDDLRLLQLASLVGVAGIGFAMAWVASLTALLIQNAGRRQFRAHIVALVVALAAIYSYGSLRLFTEQTGETVRVAGIVADLGPTPTGLPDAASVARNTDELFARSETAAGRGARLVVWNEAATVVEAADESLFLNRGAELARRHGIDLVLAYIVPLTNAHYRMENKYVWFAQDGELLDTYHKHHPVPGEGSLKSEEPLRMIPRPYANVAGAICYDYDFPAMALSHSQLGAGLVVVPSSDWRGIDPYHTQMARVRAIEGGFSVLRPVRWATSGAFDAFGRSRATMSHFESNDRIIEATLPVTQVATLYSRIGDSASFGYAFILLGAIAAGARRKRRGLGALAPLVIIALLAGCNNAKASPTDPGSEPIPQTPVAGSTFVLQHAGGTAAPVLTSDLTYAGGTRTRFWILGDTIRFGVNGSITRTRLHRQLDENLGFPETTNEWTSYRTGSYSQENNRVAVSWGYGIVPVPIVGGSDTLFVRSGGLTMHVKHSGTCYNCNDGPMVEYLYVRK